MTDMPRLSLRGFSRGNLVFRDHYKLSQTKIKSKDNYMLRPLIKLSFDFTNLFAKKRNFLSSLSLV